MDFHYLITCRAAKVMRKRSDIDISVWCTFDVQGKAPLTDNPLTPHGGPWGLSSCYLQTRHNYEISYPYEWGERLDETPRVAGFLFFGFCSSITVPLTRYVRRVRELRQNVRFPFLTCSRFRPECLSLLYHRYGRFSKSIRPDEVGACQLRAPLPHPF